MLNLIKLELKKFKIKGNILAAVICTICILGFISMIFFVERSEGKTTFDSYEMLFRITGTFVNATFIIFAGFLISKFIIEEYKNKTIYMLFTYPINRKKLVIAKVIIVSAFTFLSIIVSSIVISCSFYLIQILTDTTIGELTFELISQQLIVTAITAFTNSIIALVPLYFGLRKKSVPITMVTSSLMVSFLYSGSADFQMYSIIAVPIVFMLAGILIVYLAIKDLDKKDVMV